MIEEKFSKETQVLAVLLVPLAADLKHREWLLSVDLISRWMTPDAFGLMSSQLSHGFVIFEAKFADVDLGQVAEIVRVGTLVPDLHFILPHFDESSLFCVRKTFQGVLHDEAGRRLSLSEDLGAMT